MSRKFKLDEKTTFSTATVLLFGIGALKILLFGEHYNLAVNNYISFSNLLEYTFDVLRGLLYSAIPVVIFIILSDHLIPLLKKPIAACLSTALLGASILLVIYCYYCVTMTYCANFWIKYLLEFGIFCAGISVKSQRWVRNFEVVKLALLICFLYGYLKIESKYVVYSINKEKDKVSKIVLKDDSSKDSAIFTTSGNYIILSTTDFIFLYNDTTKHVTTIPMANVLLFIDKITDPQKVRH